MNTILLLAQLLCLLLITLGFGFQLFYFGKWMKTQMQINRITSERLKALETRTP